MESRAFSSRAQSLTFSSRNKSRAISSREKSQRFSPQEEEIRSSSPTGEQILVSAKSYFPVLVCHRSELTEGEVGIRYEALGIPYVVAIELPDENDTPDVEDNAIFSFMGGSKPKQIEDIPGIENYEFITDEVEINLDVVKPPDFVTDGIPDPLGMKGPKIPECTEFYHGKCYNALIKLIIQMDVEGVGNLLESHKTFDSKIIDVECVCGVCHYSDNIAYTLDCFGANALNIAVLLVFQVSDQDTVLQICRKLLEYGCDPDLVPANGKSVLDAATLEGEMELMKVLVEYGADINKSLQRLTNLVSIGEKQSTGHDAFSLEPIEMLLSEEVLLCAPDPLETAFFSCMLLDEIASKHVNFVAELDELREAVEMATFNYVDLCKDTWEAKLLVAKNVTSCIDERTMTLLKYGIECSQKHFTSHKFVQHIAQGLWYGDSYDGGGYFGTVKRFIALILINIVFPVLMIKKFCCQESVDPYSIENRVVTSANVPSVAFAVDVINHITLTALFINCCFINSFGELDFWEVFLWSAIVGRIIVEFEFARSQGFLNYLGKYENLIEVVVGLTIVISIIAYVADAISEDHELHIRLILINRYSYSIAASGLVIKCSMMIKISKTLGPLTETIVRMTEDILSFLVISFLLILGFAIPLYTIAYQTYYAHSHMGTTGISINSNYISFNHTLGYLGYSLFGYGAGFSATISYDWFASFTANTIYFLYMVGLTVLLMNLLIAILNSTYSDVYENASREWLFGKVEQLSKYQDTPPFLFPCILYLYPFYILFLWGEKCFPPPALDEETFLLKMYSQEQMRDEFANQNVKLHKTLKYKFRTTKIDEEAAEANRRKWEAAHASANAERKRAVKRQTTAFDIIKKILF